MSALGVAANYTTSRCGFKAVDEFRDPLELCLAVYFILELNEEAIK